MVKKVKHTTVNLTPVAQEIKERLTCEWDLKKVLSAALLLFDRQDHLMQKRMILEAGGGTADSVQGPSTVLKICSPEESRTLDRLRALLGPDEVTHVLDQAVAAVEDESDAAHTSKAKKHKPRRRPSKRA